jgi:hypothetical protein
MSERIPTDAELNTLLFGLGQKFSEGLVPSVHVGADGVRPQGSTENPAPVPTRKLKPFHVPCPVCLGFGSRYVAAWANMAPGGTSMPCPRGGATGQLRVPVFDYMLLRVALRLQHLLRKYNS